MQCPASVCLGLRTDYSGYLSHLYLALFHCFFFLFSSIIYFYTILLYTCFALRINLFVFLGLIRFKVLITLVLCFVGALF